MPILNQFNIVAKDFDKTVEFYRRVGVNVPDGVNLPNGTRHTSVTLPNGMVFEVDNPALAQIYNAGWQRPEGSSPVVIGFTFPTREAVDQCYGELVEAGYESRQPPFDAFWGARYAIVADPNGNDVGLMSPIDEKRRTRPPIEPPPPQSLSTNYKPLPNL